MIKPFLIYVFCPLYILCASMCCKEENEPNYDDYSVNIPNTIFVEDDKNMFTIGDTLWINIQIPNVLKDVEDKELNIYELTLQNTALINLSLFLETDFEQAATINISESEIINVIGTMSTNEHDTRVISSEAILTNDFYLAKHGILLRQAGKFKIKPLFESKLIYYFSSEYNNDLVNYINLETTLRSSTSDSEYMFEVLK